MSEPFDVCITGYASIVLAGLSGSADAALRSRATLSRGRRSEPGAACWRPATALGAVFVGVLIGQLAALALIVTAGDARETLALSLLLGDLLLVAVVIAVAARGAERLGAATLGIRRTSWGPAIGWGAALLVAGFAVQGLLSALLTGEGSETSTVRFSASTAVLVTLGVAVTAPIAEEIAFRGYLFPSLTRWRGPWIAASVTAVLFGAAHFAALPLALVPAAAFFGFTMCLLFWFTGSLIPPVVIHSLNNALVLTFVTEGQLAPAILAAPLMSLLLLLSFARERVPAESHS